MLTLQPSNALLRLAATTETAKKPSFKSKSKPKSKPKGKKK
jgi:hypothetical protein